MGGVADSYVLVQGRSFDLVMQFLDRFLQQREQAAAEYEVPRFSDTPRFVFRHAVDLMAYCAKYLDEPHAIYFRNTTAGEPAHAMIFYTADGEMILGLSTQVSRAGRFLDELKAFAGSDTGYIDYETPPPDTAAEFRALANKA